MNALNERRKTIADGLAAAEEGLRERERGKQDADQLIEQAKSQAKEIISRAEKRGTEVVAHASDEARLEGERILNAARSEIDMEVNQAREQLRVQVAQLAVAGAERILTKEIDQRAHEKMLHELAQSL